MPMRTLPQADKGETDDSGRDKEAKTMTAHPVAQELEELLPCSCGGGLMIVELVFTGYTKWQVSCGGCQRGTAQSDTKALAYESWNKRAFTQATGAGLPDTQRLPVDYYAEKDERPDPVNSEWAKFNDCVRMAKAYKALKQESSEAMDVARQSINGMALQLNEAEQRADNLQRELEAARNAIKTLVSHDCTMPVLDDASISACVLSGKCGCDTGNHKAAIDSARSERGGG